MSWSDLSGWWANEVTSDGAYESVVTPLLLEVFSPVPGALYLDLGSGEGRVVRTISELGASVIGVDLSERLAAASPSQVVVAEIPPIPILADAVDGVYLVLTVEHIGDHLGLFKETSRVTRPRGVMALVVNHPIWTAPGSTPINDEDGEVLWRPGEYFSSGSTDVPAGEGPVTFHHRTMASLLNAAANAGWSLEQMVEQPHHEFVDQTGIPRLLACRWRLLP